MSVLRKLFFFLIFILLVLTFVYRQLISYGLSQLAGQWNVISNARPLDEVLKDSAFPDSLKLRLTFIQQVRQFAVDSLGLNESENYTSVYDQHGRPLLLVLSASEPFRIQAYQWSFPLLGDVPYKGFFDFKKAREEESALRSKGYDTDLGEVSAWSTLGWFKDPILTGMLDRTDGQLAELIIHELTHSTLYVKSNVDFNENLASFVGEQGAIQFLRSNFSDSSKVFLDYIHRLDDYNLFSRYMVSATKKLDSLYISVQDKSVKEKEQVKQKGINDLISGVDQVPFNDKLRFSRIFKKRKPNNAFLLNYIRYDAQKDSLLQLFQTQHHSDFKSFIATMKKAYAK